MRLASFLDPTGSLRAGEVRDDHIVAFQTGSVVDRLAEHEIAPASGEPFALADVTLQAPVPQPRAIFGVGLNYREHARETGMELPEAPLIFMKLPSSSVAPGGPVRCPQVIRRLDYECELGGVMGPEGRIADYAVADDVSGRDLQKRENQWTRAKGFDTSCPWGPWITTADEIADPRGLRITTHVNDELRQHGNTSDLIFGPEEVVAFIAEACTLEPGAI